MEYADREGLDDDARDVFARVIRDLDVALRAFHREEAASSQAAAPARRA